MVSVVCSVYRNAGTVREPCTRLAPLPDEILLVHDACLERSWDAILRWERP
jgi:hypothetical protein